MAKAKGTGISSYVRIFESFKKTVEFQMVERSFVERLRTMKVSSIVVLKSWESSKLPDGYPNYKFAIGYGDTVHVKVEQTAVYVSLNELVHRSDIDLLMSRFGKGVSTFNVKPEKIRADLKVKLVTYFEEHFDQLKVDTIERIKHEIAHLLNSGEVQRCRVKSYEDEAVQEIRNKLLAYRNVSPELMKRAIDEFIVYDLLSN
jgi:hypothetical protein